MKNQPLTLADYTRFLRDNPAWSKLVECAEEKLRGELEEILTTEDKDKREVQLLKVKHQREFWTWLNGKLSNTANER